MAVTGGVADNRNVVNPILTGAMCPPLHECGVP